MFKCDIDKLKNKKNYLDGKIIKYLTLYNTVYTILLMKVLLRVIEFSWDKGNIDKNRKKHDVSNKECEEVFFDKDKQEYPDPRHSRQENRKIIVGKTIKGRILFIVFTFRNNKIRIISARDLNKRKEADLYEKAA